MKSIAYIMLISAGFSLFAGPSEGLQSQLQSIQEQIHLLPKNIDQVQNKLDRDQRVFGSIQAPTLCQGRLTTESGVAVSTADRAAQGTIYFTPYQGNRIGLFNGTNWTFPDFSEVSLALASLTSGANYDAFIWDDGGTIKLALGTAWASNTARVSGSAGEIELLNGVYVNKYIDGDMGAQEGRYVGTIRTTATNTTEDSLTKRFVWNFCHRFERTLHFKDTTDSWSYASTTVRQTNGATGNKAEWVSGMADTHVLVRALGLVRSGTASAQIAVGIGIDSTTVDSSFYRGFMPASSTFMPQVWAEYRGYPGLGYHYAASLEYNGGATITYYGDNGTAIQQSGTVGFIEG